MSPETADSRMQAVKLYSLVNGLRAFVRKTESDPFREPLEKTFAHGRFSSAKGHIIRKDGAGMTFPGGSVAILSTALSRARGQRPLGRSRCVRAAAELRARTHGRRPTVPRAGRRPPLFRASLRPSCTAAAHRMRPAAGLRARMRRWWLTASLCGRGSPSPPHGGRLAAPRQKGGRPAVERGARKEGLCSR